jgi:pSer/pThr/pTyr-binding forkhead associated (FHA) protein/type II secretory pathway predicted ATPase ExeA
MGEAHRLVSPARVFARPTADDVWLGAVQQAALSQLSRPAPVRALVGPPSSGKTTLLQHLGTRLNATAAVLRCRGPKQDASAVLASLLLSADLGPWELSEVEQRNLFTVFLQQRHSQGRRVVVLIDDAHNLTPAAIEELERLLAFKVDKKPALELVLAGPPVVGKHWQDTCGRLGLGATLVHALEPASQQDLIAYLDWRLRRFDLHTGMTPRAVQMIARLSGGRFAAADVLCQMSLLVLRRLTLERVDARVVRQAVAALAARQGAKLDTDRPSAVENRRAPPQGFVVASRGGKVIARVALGQRTLLGRSEHNDVCLPSPYLSRHHAVIVGTPEGYYLVDLNSANGVFLNGRRVERAVLCDDDLLAMGPFRLKVQVPEWLPEGSPLPEEPSLMDTAVMPQQAEESATLWRIK